MKLIAEKYGMKAYYDHGGWGKAILIKDGWLDLNCYNLDGERKGKGRYMAPYQKEWADELAQEAAGILTESAT